MFYDFQVTLTFIDWTDSKAFKGKRYCWPISVGFYWFDVVDMYHLQRMTSRLVSKLCFKWNYNIYIKCVTSIDVYPRACCSLKEYQLVHVNRSHTYDTSGFNVNKNMIYLIRVMILERRMRKTNAFNGHIQPSFEKPVLGANTSVKILGLLTVLANVCTWTCIYICNNVSLDEREFYSIFILDHTSSIIILLYVFDKHCKTTRKHGENQYFFENLVSFLTLKSNIRCKYRTSKIYWFCF